MPLYDYQCAACGAVFEAEHGMAARPKLKCPQCGSPRTAKLFNAAGVQFKGSGFYVTDSRGKATGNTADAAPSGAETSPAQVTPAVPATTTKDTKSGGAGKSGKTA